MHVQYMYMYSCTCDLHIQLQLEMHSIVWAHLSHLEHIIGILFFVNL